MRSEPNGPAMSGSAREAELIRMAQAGDTEAAKELLVGHYGFVRKMTARGLPPHLTFEEQEEWLSWGVESFYRALNTFDPDRGYRFLTYLGNAIIRNVKLTYDETRGLIDLPRRQAPMAHLDPLRAKSRRVISFDAPSGEREDSDSYWRRPADPEDLGHGDDLERMRLCFDALSPRMQTVLRMRMNGVTLAETGRNIGKTRERARQIENKAVGLMRKMMGVDADGGT